MLFDSHFSGAVRSVILSMAAATAGLLGGCVLPYDTTEVGVVAFDADNGMPVDGVRIFRHVEKPGLLNAPADAVAVTDRDGTATFEVPRLTSRWLVLRDGYEPVLVSLREAGDEPETGRFEMATSWDEVREFGVMDIPLVPTRWDPVMFSVLDAETGGGVLGASVTVESVSFFDREVGGDLYGVPVRVVQQTDANGVVMLNLPSGMRSSVFVSAERHEPGSVEFDPTSLAGLPSRYSMHLDRHLFQPTRVLVLDRGTGLPAEGIVVRVALLDAEDGSPVRDSIWRTGPDGTVVVMKPSSGLGVLSIECENRLPSEFSVVEMVSGDLRSVAIGFDGFD